MKKVMMLAVCLILANSTLLSQWYIGLTERELIEQLGVTRIQKVYDKHAPDTSFDIMWDVDSIGSSRMVSFTNSKSDASFLFPYSKDRLTSWVSFFNDNKVKVSDTEWTDYKGGKIYSIRLKYDEDLKDYYFIMTKKGK